MPFNTYSNGFPCDKCTEHTATCHVDCSQYFKARAASEQKKAEQKRVLKGDDTAKSVLIESRQHFIRRHS